MCWCVHYKPQLYAASLAAVKPMPSGQSVLTEVQVADPDLPDVALTVADAGSPPSETLAADPRTALSLDPPGEIDSIAVMVDSLDYRVNLASPGRRVFAPTASDLDPAYAGQA